MTKKSFEEQYPNHRSEKRNERIVLMTPAIGWWKATVFLEDDEVFYEPVAFFATCHWEERNIWDGGHSGWENQQVIYAHTGIGDEWFMAHLDEVFGLSCTESRLFYDPHFKRTKEEQGINDEWISEMKKHIQERIDRNKK